MQFCEPLKLDSKSYLQMKWEIIQLTFSASLLSGISNEVTDKDLIEIATMEKSSRFNFNVGLLVVH